MRIAVATWTREVVGGAEAYLRTVIPALLARGHDVGLLHELESSNAQARIDPVGAAIPKWSLEALGREAALARLADWRPDVVYLHGFVEPAHEALLLDRYPCFLYGHNYVGTCVTGTKRFVRPGWQACTRTLGPGCLPRVPLRGCGGLNPLRLAADYRLQRRRQRLLPRYAAVLVASQHMHDEFVRTGVPPRRVRLLPYPVAYGALDPAPDLDRPLSGRVLFVGRLTRLKGARLLVEAVRLASVRLGRALTLAVAGSGPELEWIQRRAQALSVSLEYKGWVDETARSELMRSSDVLAVPSLWPEPFGLVGIEAGCVALPAVAFAVGGIPDWLEAGSSGELATATPPSAASLADALGAALRDPTHLRRLRRGAWERAHHFGLEAHLAALEATFADAAAEWGDA